MGNVITADVLDSVWTVKKQIDVQSRRLRDLEAMAESTTAFIDGMPHAQSLTGKVEHFVSLIDDCKRTIAALTEQLVQCKLNVLSLLQAQQLSEPCERVLTYHYVDCLKHDEIAKRMHYNRSYIWKLFRRGLKAIGVNS